MKKSLKEIVSMSDEELSDYYQSRQMLNEGEDDSVEHLGEMTREELIRKYNLIPDSDAQQIIDEMLNGHAGSSISNS